MVIKLRFVQGVGEIRPSVTPGLRAKGDVEGGGNQKHK